MRKLLLIFVAMMCLGLAGCGGGGGGGSNLQNNIGGGNLQHNNGGLTTRADGATVGSKAVGLDHTNFGFWEFSVVNSANSASFSSDRPFILEGPSAVKVAPPNSGTFNGTVLANAFDLQYGVGKTASLVGTARLSLDSATAGNLTFTFPNFNTMATGLNISGDGSITANGFFSVSPDHDGKNNTGIYLGNTSGVMAHFTTSTVQGQFYSGSAASPAKEAVGVFEYSRNVNDIYVGIRGSFGVK